MSDEIELISDGDGVAVIGPSTAVERFLAAEGLVSAALDHSRLTSMLRTGSTVAQHASELSANSGRWLKLTKKSAEQLHKYPLTPTGKNGVKYAMLGQRGSIKKWLQVETGPGAVVTNPAMLAGAAGVMAQLAMQQTMDEITAYLEAIDAKLDDVLRAQTNQVLARMDGVALAVKEAMSVRDSVGRVSEVTWSKIQASSSSIMETQGYALRQLNDLADKLERQRKVDDLADTTKAAEDDVQKWLTVLARCFQLLDAIAVLELDRVLDASPAELEQHRLGLRAAREDRLALIGEHTDRLLERIQAAAATANSKVLLNPIDSPAIVRATNHVATEVHEFHELLGLEAGHHTAEARPWRSAASDSWDKVRDTSSDGVKTVRQLGSETRDRAGNVKNRLAGKLTERTSRWRKDEPDESSTESSSDDSTT